nr:hypothetical protein [Pandoravirus aubagnensis]
MEPPKRQKRKGPSDGEPQAHACLTKGDGALAVASDNSVCVSSKKRARPDETPPDTPVSHDISDDRNGGESQADDLFPFARLPDEVLGFVFQGRTASGRFVLDPRWRTFAAMTCRRWRRIVFAPTRATIAALERVRPSRASPQAWSTGRVVCASALRDAISLLPRDMGAANAWLDLVPTIGDGFNERLAAAVAVATSGNTTAIRDVRHWGIDHPCRSVPVGWFQEGDENNSLQDHSDCNGADEYDIDQRPHRDRLTVAWAVVRGACRSPMPRANLEWAMGRWNGALGAQHCDWRALSLDIAATGSPAVFDMVMQCLGPPDRRALWDCMIRACLAAPSPEATDSLLARLLEVVDGRNEHMALETATELVVRSVCDREARPERFVAFVPWLGKARRWCFLAFSADRPRAAATAIRLWGVPKCSPPRQCLEALSAADADRDVMITTAFGQMDDDTIDIDGIMDAYAQGDGDDRIDDDEHNNNNNDNNDGGVEEDDDDTDGEGGESTMSQPSERGFWCTAIVRAISGGATASLDWLLTQPDDPNGGAGPLARSVVETPELALHVVIEALCVPMGDATRLLVGLRHFNNLVPVHPLPPALIASALAICARGADLYFASGVVLAALIICPDAMRTDTLMCDLAAAAGGLLRAREWGTLDALVAAVDTAPPDLFGHRGVFDLWMAAALDCRRASVAHKTASIVEVHNLSKGLYFLAMRAGALPADALVPDVVDNHTRRDPLAADVHAWRRWCRVRPIVLDCTVADANDAITEGGILSPVDPAWTALWSCGLVRAVDAQIDE